MERLASAGMGDGWSTAGRRLSSARRPLFALRRREYERPSRTSGAVGERVARRPTTAPAPRPTISGVSIAAAPQSLATLAGFVTAPRVLAVAAPSGVCMLA